MPAIRCAHCKDRHATVAAVRLCAERIKRLRAVAFVPLTSSPHSCEDFDGECCPVRADTDYPELGDLIADYIPRTQYDAQF